MLELMLEYNFPNKLEWVLWIWVWISFLFLLWDVQVTQLKKP